MAEVIGREVPRLRRLPDDIEATDTARATTAVRVWRHRIRDKLRRSSYRAPDHNLSLRRI